MVKNLPASKRHVFDPWVMKIHWRKKWHPTTEFCLGNPVGRVSWRAAVYKVTKSRHDLVTK